MNGGDSKRLEIRKRSYKHFDPVEYRTRLAQEDWEQIYTLNDTDLVNDYLETRLVKIMDELCPYKAIQHRKQHKPWITQNTKALMMERDRIREMARVTGEQDIWNQYRKIRNSVNANIDKDRKSHYKKMYELHETNKDVAATYKTA